MKERNNPIKSEKSVVDGVVVVGCFHGDRFNATVLFALFYVVGWLFITPETSNVSFVSGFLGVLAPVKASSLPLLSSLLSVECHALTDKSSPISQRLCHTLQMKKNKITGTE